jgi:hypothetical protein
VVFAALLGLAVGLVVAGRRHGAAHPRSRTIDMSRAVTVNCPAPIAPGPGHPGVVLSQLFRVADDHTPYLLGWEIVPYRASQARYHLGAAGSVLALEPAAGGKPLGYGDGTLTFAGGVRSGTVDAVITLMGGGAIHVGGRWSCSA